jgi:hypothetical protein
MTPSRDIAGQVFPRIFLFPADKPLLESVRSNGLIGRQLFE